MPTSASTGTRQVKTSGPKDEPKAKKPETKVDPADPTTVPTPDGAAVVTRPEDVVGGVRVDLPPSPPQNQDGPAPLADPNGVGVVQGTRDDGSVFLIQQD